MSADEAGVKEDSLDSPARKAGSSETGGQACQSTTQETVMYKSKGKHKATKKSKPTTRAKAMKQLKAVKANTKKKTVRGKRK